MSVSDDSTSPLDQFAENTLNSLTGRVDADPESVERGLVQLVLTLVELLRQLMERQAVRRLDAGAMSPEETERVGLTLMLLEKRMAEPHWVKPGDGVSVSVGVVFYTDRTRRDANVHAFNHLLRQEVSLYGACNSFSAPFPGREWTITVAMMAHGRLRTAELVSHREPLDRLPEVLAWMGERREFFSKVMFFPNGG